MTIVRLSWWGVFLIAFALILMPMLAGCADDRYLTKEQDEEMRKVCEPSGCTVIPAPAWEQIKRAIGLEGV